MSSVYWRLIAAANMRRGRDLDRGASWSHG